MPNRIKFVTRYDWHILANWPNKGNSKCNLDDSNLEINWVYHESCSTYHSSSSRHWFSSSLRLLILLSQHIVWELNIDSSMFWTSNILVHSCTQFQSTWQVNDASQIFSVCVMVHICSIKFERKFTWINIAMRNRWWYGCYAAKNSKPYPVS